MRPYRVMLRPGKGSYNQRNSHLIVHITFGINKEYEIQGN